MLYIATLDSCFQCCVGNCISNGGVVLAYYSNIFVKWTTVLIFFVLSVVSTRQSKSRDGRTHPIISDGFNDLTACGLDKISQKKPDV